MLDSINIEEIKPLGEKAIDIFIESYSSSALTLQVRGLTKNEIISASHITNSDRSLASQAISVTELPISFTIRPASTGVKRGVCYVRVSLRIEGAIVAILGAGYVTDTGAIMYPGGQNESSIEGPGVIKIVTGSNPAAGVEISETVPTGARWKLHAIGIILVTDANVANRALNFRYTTSTDVVVASTQANVNLTASATWEINGSIIGAAPLQQSNTISMPLPTIPLSAGMKIITATLALQAGDNYGAPVYVVEEWLEP